MAFRERDILSKHIYQQQSEGAVAALALCGLS